MRHHAVLLAVALTARAGATTEAPYAGHCRLLQHVVERTAQPDVALRLLRRVALGSTDGIPTEVESLLALPAGRLKEAEFTAQEVRVCAFQRIGDLKTDEAIQFLTKLTRADVGLNAPIQLWVAARIALQNALLLKIADEQEKRLFLEKILTAPHEGTGAMWVWAVNQLCDRGAMLSLGLIQRSIKEVWPGQRGQEEITFCEHRVQVVTRDPDRAKAIGSVLKAGMDPVNERLLRWAIEQLATMRTPAADAELRRFAVEVRSLTAGSKAHRLASLQQAVDNVIRERP